MGARVGVDVGPLVAGAVVGSDVDGACVTDGAFVGCAVGIKVSDGVGASGGRCDGSTAGRTDDDEVGNAVGLMLGTGVGERVGADVGLRVGPIKRCRRRRRPADRIGRRTSGRIGRRASGRARCCRRRGGLQALAPCMHKHIHRIGRTVSPARQQNALHNGVVKRSRTGVAPPGGGAVRHLMTRHW